MIIAIDLDSFCNRDTETSAGGQTQTDSVDCARRQAIGRDDRVLPRTWT